MTEDQVGRSQRFRVIVFVASSLAVITYCFLLGWALATATDSPAAAFVSFGLAAIVGIVSFYLRIFREWTSESAAAFRLKAWRLFVTIIAGMGIATLAFVVYLMARNN